MYIYDADLQMAKTGPRLVELLSCSETFRQRDTQSWTSVSQCGATTAFTSSIVTFTSDPHHIHQMCIEKIQQVRCSESADA